MRVFGVDALGVDDLGVDDLGLEGVFAPRWEPIADIVYTAHYGVQFGMGLYIEE